MRKLMLTTMLASTVAILGACENKPETPNKAATTPTPVVVASPVASPSGSPVASPTASPAKPGASPEVKKIDNSNIKKDAAPASTATPKKV